MKITKTLIHDSYVLEPNVFRDERGFFYESWNSETFNKAIKKKIAFVQDNHSHSSKGVLRGLHYQLKHPQGKLVRVVTGAVLDVAVDIRQSSPTFGAHIAVKITAESHKQLWVPPGCAHGFVVLSEHADFLYKTTDFYYPYDERCIIYDDPTLNIDWQLDDTMPQLSIKDQKGMRFDSIEYYV